MSEHASNGKLRNPVKGLLGLVGLGLLIWGMYTLKLSLMIPLGLIFLISVAVSAFRSGPPPGPLRFAWVVQTEQTVMMLLGAIEWKRFALPDYEIALLAILLIWYWLAVGWLPILLLGIYEIGTTMTNIQALFNPATSEIGERTVFVASLLHFVTLLCLIFGWLKLRRQQAVIDLGHN